MKLENPYPDLLPEMDYRYLVDHFGNHHHPRREIGKLLRQGRIIRVKKGLYVVAATAASSRPYSKEIMANLIYGPSYISLEYALSWYGWIPERVEQVASMTPKRNKHFHTPIGDFVYHYLAREKYTIGISQVTVRDTHTALMATPEKALSDLLARQALLTSLKELESHLFENLRISEECLLTCRKTHLHDIAQVYRHPNINRLYQWVQSR